MPQSFVIIDGYNLLHAAGLGRSRYGPGDLERVRNRLIRFVVNRLSDRERQRTTIVFDATGTDAGPGDFELDSVRICFNRPGSDADTLIEELISKHSAPKQLTVVSGDRRLKTAIQRRRGTPIDSETYYEQIAAREPRTTEDNAADVANAANAASDRSDVSQTDRAVTEGLLNHLELEMLQSFEHAADLKSKVVLPDKPVDDSR